MDKERVLDEIFSDDPLGLLNVKVKSTGVRSADERLQSNFEEINSFIDKHGKEPEPNIANISEFQLYSRLKGLREDKEKAGSLKSIDKYKLLPESESNEVNEPQPEYKKKASKKLESIDDILGDDMLDILGGDDGGLFDFKHTPKDFEREDADFVATRKPCKNFEDYEATFKAVQHDLAKGKRKLIKFKQENLRPGDFYVHNGILLLLESVDFEEEMQPYNSGARVRKDGRTRTIFENGTESRMLYRSLYKAILSNGKAVSRNEDVSNEEFIKHFEGVKDEDEEAGYIYVLKSKSEDEKIKSISNLYKIGYSRVEVESRIKDAEKEPTYLMAPVEYIAGWKCYNMNTQKFEQLIHNFFGSSCLEVDVFDKKGKRHTPREWFIAPLAVIEQAIALIISGKIVKYRYDERNKMILER